jgi:hypothetical protein
MKSEEERERERERRDKRGDLTLNPRFSSEIQKEI